MERQQCSTSSYNTTSTSAISATTPTTPVSSFQTWGCRPLAAFKELPHNPAPNDSTSTLPHPPPRRRPSQPVTTISRCRRKETWRSFTTARLLLSLSSIAAMAVIASLVSAPTVAAGLEAEGDSARQLCGRMLMSHVKRVCTQPAACGGGNSQQPQPLPQSTTQNDDLNSNGNSVGGGRQKRQVRDLFRQCCTQGCTRAFIRDYCCGDSPPPPPAASSQQQPPSNSNIIDNALPQQPQGLQPQLVVSPCQYHQYSVHSPVPTQIRSAVTSLLDGDKAEFSSGNITHLLADDNESNGGGRAAGRRHHPHHKHRHHRRPATHNSSSSSIDDDDELSREGEEKHRFEKLKRALLVHKAVGKLNSESLRV